MTIMFSQQTCPQEFVEIPQKMLTETRFNSHFDVKGDFNNHFGIFACDDSSSQSKSDKGCC